MMNYLAHFDLGLLAMFDLPLIWACVLVFVVFAYVVLDGFDLGIGILLPLARSQNERLAMVRSIAPVWDGNESWLVLGGIGLFAAFPQAYAILLPAFYMPIGIVLTALVFRGVVFEFMAQSGPMGRNFWGQGFHWGSVVAAFFQGVILGAFVQGIKVSQGQFSGTAFDWLTPFSCIVGAAMVSGYALLGSCWLVIKMRDELLVWSRRVALGLVLAVWFFMALVAIWALFLNVGIGPRWGFDGFNIDWFRLMPLLPAPLGVLGFGVWLIWAIRAHAVCQPYFAALGLFAMGYLGLGFSLYPMIVPHHLTFWQAAGAPNSQAFLLVGVVMILPVVFGYTAYTYWAFRGKVGSVDDH